MKLVMSVKKVSIMIAISMFSYAVLAGAEKAIRTLEIVAPRTPLSLAIFYHRATASFNDVNIDNGFIAGSLVSVIEEKVPAILVSGTIAYPLIYTTLIGYLQKQHSPLLAQFEGLLAGEIRASPGLDVCLQVGHNWNLFCTSDYGSAFLTQYTPYLVKKTDKLDSPYTDERFVLFIRNDSPFDIAQVFNVKRLQRVDWDWEDDLAFEERILTLLLNVNNHTEVTDTIARSMASIFNRYQTQYSWNIVVIGHGTQMEQLDMPLLTRASSSEGMVANMPPRQFGFLLDFFNTMPVNIVALSTCYSGGYNALLMERELDLFSVVTMWNAFPDAVSQYERIKLAAMSAKKSAISFKEFLHSARMASRSLVLVSMAAFDEIVQCATPGIWLQQFEQLFSTSPRLENDALKRRIEEILWRGCKEPSIILMPNSDTFELLTKPECLQDLLHAVADNTQTSLRSVELLNEYAKKYVPDTDVLKIIFKRALTRRRVSLLKEIIQEYAFEDDGRIAARLGSTALILATVGGLSARVEKLLVEGTDVNAKDTYGNTALVYAIQLELPDIAKLLLDYGAYANTHDKDDIPVLMLAVETGQPDVSAKLLDKGANPNVMREPDFTVLMYAVQHHQLAVVEKLVAVGADVNARSSQGSTVLMQAIMTNRPDIAEKLLAGGADVHAQNSDGFTALMFAAWYDQPVIVEKLLAKGADVRVTARNGKTALMLAEEKGNQQILAMLKHAASLVASV